MKQKSPGKTRAETFGEILQLLFHYSTLFKWLCQEENIV
jgi:hypothetical protein